MKYLKYFETLIETDINYICKKYGITDYTINTDGSIDVDGDVYLHNKNLTKIPLKFRNVSGYFNCSNNKLISLQFAPSRVGNYFYCHYNQLTSLEFCPIYIGDDFSCDNNQLSSLEFCPRRVGRDFICDNNQLTSLEFCPSHVGGIFSFSFNEITSLEFCPSHVGGYFCCFGNPVENILDLFRDHSKIELFNDYDIIRGDSIVLDRLNEFLEVIGKPTVAGVDGYKNI